MLVLGLVHDSDWDPPPEEGDPPPRARGWHLPWRPLAWVAIWCWLMALVPLVSDALA
jgi:hypothetical protein